MIMAMLWDVLTWPPALLFHVNTSHLWTYGGPCPVSPDPWKSPRIRTPAMRACSGLLYLLVHVLARARGQYDMCKSLVSTDEGAVWEHYACQPKAQAMKEYMRIRVEPPGVTCGNPPERFCTLVSPLEKNTTLFYEDVINWSKVTVKTFIVLKKISKCSQKI